MHAMVAEQHGARQTDQTAAYDENRDFDVSHGCDLRASSLLEPAWFCLTAALLSFRAARRRNREPPGIRTCRRTADPPFRAQSLHPSHFARDDKITGRNEDGRGPAWSKVLRKRYYVGRNEGCLNSHLLRRSSKMRAIDENTITEAVVDQMS